MFVLIIWSILFGEHFCENKFPYHFQTRSRAQPPDSCLCNARPIEIHQFSATCQKPPPGFRLLNSVLLRADPFRRRIECCNWSTFQMTVQTVSMPRSRVGPLREAEPTGPVPQTASTHIIRVTGFIHLKTSWFSPIMNVSFIKWISSW